VGKLFSHEKNDDDARGKKINKRWRVDEGVCEFFLIISGGVVFQFIFLLDGQHVKYMTVTYPPDSNLPWTFCRIVWFLGKLVIIISGGRPCKF